MKPVLMIHPTTRNIDNVIVFRQYGDYISQAYEMSRDSLFDMLAHPRVRAQYADIVYDNRLR